MNPLRFSTHVISSKQNYSLHLGLFLLTVFTTLWAGTFWGGHPATLDSIPLFIHALATGTSYSASLLLFLSVHEFGHFFASQRHRVRATLPYYIPLPPLPFFLSLGTMGAVIKVKERIPETNDWLDSVIWCPMSGLAVCVGLLIFGFLNLPPADFITTIHPEYLTQGGLQAPVPKGTLILGKNLLWGGLEYVLAPKNLPPMTEMYHYPFLFTGWLGSIVTALNLLPVGQLDGGHITYAMFGRKGHAKAARIILIFITLLGFPAVLELLLSLLIPDAISLIPPVMLQWSWSGWILWAFIFSRLTGVDHPPTLHDHELDVQRKVYGWAAIAVFCITFTPVPFGVT